VRALGDFYKILANANARIVQDGLENAFDASFETASTGKPQTVLFDRVGPTRRCRA